MSVKLLTEHHLEFLSLKGGCTGISESTFVKMPHCWKSHVAAQLFLRLKLIKVVCQIGFAYTVLKFSSTKSHVLLLHSLPRF